MTIAFFTTTRAEFGLLLPLIKSVEENQVLNYELFVGGTHLAEAYGSTIHEIRASGVKISSTFDYIPPQTDPAALLNSLATETRELVKIFMEWSFDAICVLGDRYELLPVVQAAILLKKKIIHLHGGEKSEGAIDEQIRHMITKSAHLHFTACEAYAENIRKMGEQSWRVHATGALAIDNVTKMVPVPEEALFDELNLKPGHSTVLLTYHPVSLEEGLAQAMQIENIFKALDRFDFQIIITAPGADPNRDDIVNEILTQVKRNDNFHYFESLGIRSYLSLIPYCRFVIGNSSSGIIEVPYFKIPTVNIGRRQQGRLQHPSVIDAGYSEESIHQAILKATNEDFRKSIADMEYMFGDGRAAERMTSKMESLLFKEDILMKSLSF